MVRGMRRERVRLKQCDKLQRPWRLREWVWERAFHWSHIHLALRFQFPLSVRTPLMLLYVEQDIFSLPG